MTVVELASRRKGWTPVDQITGEWVLSVECPWCRSRFTIELADAAGPVRPLCCGGPALRVLAARLPG